jgi:hypothetical protein
VLSTVKCAFVQACLFFACLGSQAAAAEQPAGPPAAAARTEQPESGAPWSVRVINTSPDRDGGALVVQNSVSDARSVYQTTIPADYLFADNVRSTIRVESGARISVQHTAAYGAYVFNACSWGKAPHECNGVGLFSQAIAGAASAQSWPINTACNDNGHASSCGNEHDVTVQSGLATYTLWSGIIQGAVQPANANGIQLSKVPGATAQWTNGFVTGNGSAQNFASAGALETSGQNVPSQPLWMSAFDEDGREFAVKLQSAGHAVAVLDNTRPDGLALEAGNSLVGLRAIGSSRNTDMGLAAKGDGKIVAKSTLQLPDSSTWSQSGLRAANDLDIDAHELRNVRSVRGTPGTSLAISCGGACATHIGSDAINILSVDSRENAANPGNASAELGNRTKAWAATTTKMLNLSATHFEDLPKCNTSSSGTIAFVNDAIEPITIWHQPVYTGGGTNTAFVSCNGRQWHAFDY